MCAPLTRDTSALLLLYVLAPELRARAILATSLSEPSRLAVLDSIDAVVISLAASATGRDRKCDLKVPGALIPATLSSM